MKKSTCSQVVNARWFQRGILNHLAATCSVAALSALVLSGLVVAPSARADTGAPPLAPVVALSAEGGNGTVLGDRCNVRSRPSTTAEVVAQLNKGASVQVVGNKKVTEGGRERDWLNIELPDSAKCYVSSQYLADGTVTGDSLYVRCGAGKNYRHVGKLAKDARVEVIGQEGEWTRIKPTAACTGWIAAELVEVVAVPEPEPIVVADAAPEPAVEVDDLPPAVPLEPVPAPEPTPAERVEVISTDPDVHVYSVLKTGILASAAAADAPATYQLERETNMGRRHLVCYLVPPDDVAMDRFQGKEIRVAGTMHWHRGDRYAVLHADRVERIW